MIWLLFLVLLIFLYVNYRLAKCDIFNPSVIVSAMFSVFSFFCCLANLYIGIDIEEITTIGVISIGILIFTFLNYALSRDYKIREFRVEKQDVTSIWGLIGFIIIALAIYVEYHYVMAFSAAYGLASDFFEAMVQYKIITTLKDADSFLVASPWYRGPVMTLACCFAYFSVYIFFKQAIFNNRFSFIYGNNILFYLLFSMMGGGRSEAFRTVTACIFVWYIFYRKYLGKQFNIRIVLLKIISLLIVVSLFFISFIHIIGRSQADMDLESAIISMFVYAGAPIFNLDIYLQNPWPQTHGIFGELTFIRFINWLGVKTGDSSLVYELDLPFLSYHNYDLGNVYTTFYAFIYDFGFIGAIFLTGIMAWMSLWLYNKINFADVFSNKLSMCIVCYAYLINDIIMLPFSNRFYESIGNIGTWYKLIVFFAFMKIFNSFSKSDR